MADGELIAYSIASFICALFVLEFGADKFIDHTAIVAKRIGVPQTLIALLTAGAEWEELAVVVFSVLHHRPSLALGNIVGSTISNILGAFSLGLLFHSQNDGPVNFDRSSKFYTALQLVVTILIAAMLRFGKSFDRKLAGASLISLFALYVASVLWAISTGTLAAPEMSDDGDSSDSDDDQILPEQNLDADDEETPTQSYGTFDPSNHERTGPRTGDGHDSLPRFSGNPLQPASCSPTPSGSSISHYASAPVVATSVRASESGVFGVVKHSLLYHIAWLLMGFIALSLSAYVLSNAASTIVTALGMSDILFGVVILSLATTLPEKFVAVVSGARGQDGILVANTVGSNIFLLTLCMGIFMVCTGEQITGESVNTVEIGFMLGSSLLLTAAVCLSGRVARYFGAVMLGAYIVFIVLEFTVIRRPGET
ncbi:hypothetical protein LTR91_019665 [Friedmanniomyces endolithicus]|uniref:Sodium/calcium exchanger membrane region domain-containing protein n=1 Tax=Friedmanniomyces endolithicus TaxID=329885 RepID=A0AAN6HA70_9PEZI|nr:hypothetical protein LTS00_016643 [Friedmanniomyces endolithicus]KAK0277516.1 hypothetical protein LTR35_009918 [Friedmanniomyces endolithicus]KAK0319994.1 hypothetical protein LTR82_008929 [Friedmanniomyces endolithicus]KAK0923868.1 hypothetical protein LTR57_006528 [Friedmanniomyces endolithicus]KAK0961989.1 hypothetical protein LTR91_019665 [Friedmanniomyces endolithicus]